MAGESTDYPSGVPIAAGQDYGEGLYTAVPVAMSFGAIAAMTVDMYGGPFGRFLTVAGGPPGFTPPTEPYGPIGGGVTGPPDEWGGSSGYVGGSNSTTKPTGGSPHTPNSSYGGGGTPQVFLENIQRQVNTGLWGVPGFGWSGNYPVDPYRAKFSKPLNWYMHPPAQEPKGWNPKRFNGVESGPRVDPFFSIRPPFDTFDPMEHLSPYEYEVPFEYFHKIGDVVTFPGNPANDNSPVGPGGGPHNWDNYRRQAYLARQIERILRGNLGQGL